MNIYRTARSNRNLVGIAENLERRAGVATAERFLQRAEEAYQKLTAMPFLGGEAPHLPAEHQDVRVWPIKGFAKYLIYYRPVEDGIQILCVLYGMRDLPDAFTEDSGN
jgi:toxin ParE1/3/4